MYQRLTCPPAHPVYVFSCSYVSLPSRGPCPPASSRVAKSARARAVLATAWERRPRPGSPAGQQHRAPPPAPTSAGPPRSACTCTSHCHCHSATHPRHLKLRHLYAGAQALRPALVPVEGASLRPLCACPSHHSPRPMPRCSRQPLHFVFSLRHMQRAPTHVALCTHFLSRSPPLVLLPVYPLPAPPSLRPPAPIPISHQVHMGRTPGACT